MNIWKVLDIDKTENKDEIREAYRKKLVTCNPEEDQEGFMELRQAYDEAMRQADISENKADNGEGSSHKGDDEGKESTGYKWDNTPVGIWMSKVDEVYRDIKKRAQASVWQELLDDEVCFSLDTKTTARNELLKYLMDNNYLPQRIWIMLNEKFMLIEYKQELYELFPKNYIDRGVIDNIKYKDFIDFDRVESLGGEDYDEYFRACNSAYFQISNEEFDKALENLEKMKTLKIYHPYSELCEARYYHKKGEFDKSEEIIDRLLLKYPDDNLIIRNKAVICAKKEQYQEAAGYYEKILESEPDYYDVLVELGNVYLACGDYKNAKDNFDRAGDIHKSNYVQDNIELCIDKLDEIYQKRYEENPNDIDNCIELARTKYQRLKPLEAIEFLIHITPDEKNRIEYAHILGCCYMYNGEYEKALPYLQEWMTKTEQLKEDGTKETDKAIKRLTYAYLYMAYTLNEYQDRHEEADRYIEKAIATNYNTIDAYEYKARIYFKRKKYEEVMQICDDILSYDINSVTAYAFRAQALYELGYVSDASEEWDKCIRIEPYDLGLYITKMECLLDISEYDKINEVIEYLESNGVENERIDKIKFVIQAYTGDWKQAFEKLSGLIETVEKKNSSEEVDKNFLAELYFEYARICMNKAEDSDKAAIYLDKALEINDKYVKALNWKAYDLWKKGEFEKALELYNRLLREKPYHLSANGHIGEIYEAMRRYDDAIDYYTRQLKVGPNAYIYLSRGWCLANIYRYEEAREDYRRSIQLDEEAVSAYRNMANTYVYEGQEEKALELYRTALKNDKDGDEPYIYKNLAYAYTRMDNKDEAMKVMEECVKRYDNPIHLLELARIYMVCGEYEKSLDVCARYSQLGDKYRYKITDRVCECLMLLGKFDVAEGLIKNAFTKGREFEDKNGACINRYNMHFLKLYIRICKNRYFTLSLKSELGEMIKCYIDEDNSHGEWIVMLWFLLELRHHSYKKVKYNSPVLSQVMEKFAGGIKEDERACEREPGILSDRAVILMNGGRLDEALECVNKALNTRKCYTCEFCGCADAMFRKALILELMGKEEEAYEFYRQAVITDKTDIMYKMEFDRLKNKLGKA